MKSFLQKSRRLFPIVLIVLATLTLSACRATYGPSPTPTPTPAPTPSGNSVTMSGFAFHPQTLTVKAGTTVTWANNDAVDHTVTSDTNLFASDKLGKNATFSYTFSNAGTFAYHCSIHKTMKGTIVVQ
jgi:plastocyanin